MEIANIIILLLGAIGGPTTIGVLYKWAKAQGYAQAVQERTLRAIKTKNREIALLRESLLKVKRERDDAREELKQLRADHRREIEELRAENQRLWSMLPSPPEKPLSGSP